MKHYLSSYLLCTVLVLLPALLPAQEENSAYDEFVRQSVPNTLVRDIDLDPCSQCHRSEFNIWKQTPHSSGFYERHRTNRSQEIVKAMGFKEAKRNSLCIRCHYTPNEKNDKLVAIAGVSCESCHGVARQWEPLHYDFGTSGSDFGDRKDAESADHRQQRLKAVREAGMLRPSEIYPVVANCFDCHTVIHERLVNVGGHGSGNSSFDLPTKLAAINHNFLQSFLYGTGEEIAQPSMERKRLFFLFGRILSLEYSLRGAATATEEGAYFDNMKEGSESALFGLEEVAQALTLPELNRIIQAGKSATIAINNSAPLNAAADQVKKSALVMAGKYQGGDLAAIDPVLLGLASEAPPVAEEIGTPPAGNNPADAAVTPDSNNPVAAAAPQVSNPHQQKSKLRPASKHATIGAKNCNPCHPSQQSWWKKDPHFRTLAPFTANDPKVIRIARNYGIPAGSITNGTTLCMDCHGTVITSKKNRAVRDGVSCESCHGGAKDFHKPHQVEGGAYAAGKQYGMKQLEQANVRAVNCSECHYITDKRLLAAGHPSGSSFKLTERDTKIRHWEAPNVAGLDNAYAAAISARGAIPKVEIIDIPIAQIAAGGGGNPAAPGAVAPVTNIAGVSPGGGVSRVVVRYRESLKLWPSHAAEISIGPLPEIRDDASIEEIMQILQERMEIIYEKSGKP